MSGRSWLRRYGGTLVLVGAAAALGVGLWVDRDHLTESERELRRSNVFVGWERDALARIEISHEGETLVLARDVATDSAWKLAAPVSAGVDQAVVERLIMTLEFATVLRKVSEGPGLGFEAPRATGRLVMGARTVTFALGAPATRPEGAAYFRVDGGPPIVVSSELAGALLKPSDAYRDRSLVPYLSIELARFEVTSPSAGFVLERRGETSFVVANEGVRASRKALDLVWGSLSELRADRFVEPDAARGAELLSFRMTPKASDKAPAEFVVTEGCQDLPDDVLLVRTVPTPLAACVPRAALGGLRTTAAELVDTQLFQLHADEVEEVRLEWLAPAGAPGVSPVELARKGDGFHQRFPVDRDLDAAESDAATVLVDRLAGLTAERVSRASTEPGKAGVEAFTVRARVRSGEVEESIELAVPKSTPLDLGGASVHARRLTDGAELSLSPDVARWLIPQKVTLRPRVLLGDSRRVTQIELACGAPQKLADDGHGFRYVDPTGYEVDASLLDTLSALTRGRIEAWVADAPEASFGLPTKDDEGCRATLTFEGAGEPVTISFGAEREGGFFGKKSDDSSVFLAPKSLRERLSRWYVSRAYLRAPAERIADVRASYKGRSVERSPEALAEVVASLYADRVVGLGASKLPQGTPRLSLRVADKEGGKYEITCAKAVSAPEWWCELSGVRATFAVQDTKLAPLVAPPADAGVTPSDAGVAHDPGAR